MCIRDRRATKWKKNLPHTACVTGITFPKYFAVESMHTNKKKPEADRKITLNKEAFGFLDIRGFYQSIKSYITTPTCQGLNSSSP